MPAAARQPEEEEHHEHLQGVGLQVHRIGHDHHRRRMLEENLEVSVSDVVGEPLPLGILLSREEGEGRCSLAGGCIRGNWTLFCFGVRVLLVVVVG